MSMFADIRVGDRVKDVRASDDHKPFVVVKVTDKRFVCDIGENPVLGCRMYQDYRKSDGRAVGNRHHITFVRRCSPSRPDNLSIGSALS